MFRTTVLALLVVFTGVVGAPLSAQDAPPSAPLSKAGYLEGRFPTQSFSADILDAAVDELRGRVALVLRGEKSLKICDARILQSGRECLLKDIPLAGEVRSVTWKQWAGKDHWLAATANPNSLTMIDAESLTITRKVELETPAPEAMSPVRNPASALVYLTVRNQPSSIETHQYDLQELKSKWSTYFPRPVLVSQDGDTRYVFGRNPNTDHVIYAEDARRKPDATPSAAAAAAQRVVSPADLLLIDQPTAIAVGARLYSLDLKQELLRCEFVPSASLPGTTFIAGIAGPLMFIGTTNDGRILRRIAIPPEWAPRRPRMTPHNSSLIAVHAARLRSDPVNQQFLLMARNRLTAIPVVLGGATPKAGTLLATKELPKEVFVGRPVRIQLTEGGDTTVTAESPPTGLQVRGNELVWSPTINQIGDHAIALKLASSGAVREQKWIVHVALPRLNVPIVPHRANLSLDGQRIVCCNREQEVALMDVASGALVMQRDLSHRVLDADVGSESVCVLLETPVDPEDKLKRRRTVVRLDPANLNTQLESKIAGDGTRIRIIADRYVVVHAESGSSGVQRLKLEDFSNDMPFLLSSIEPGVFLEGRVSAGWIHNGVLWDETLTKPRLNIWDYSTRIYDHHHVNRLGAASAVRLRAWNWSPFEPLPGSLMLSSAGALTRRDDHETPDLPALIGAFGVQSTSASDLLPVELSLTALRQKRELKRLVVDHVARKPGMSNYLNCRLLSGRNTFVALVGEQAMVIPAADMLDGLPKVFEFQPDQPQFSLNHDQPTAFKYVAEGATKFTLEFPELQEKGQKFHFQSTDGRFEVNPAGRLDTFLEDRIRLIGNMTELLRLRPVVDRIAAYRKEVDPEATRLLGRPPTGIVTPIRAVVSAENAEFEQAFLVHDFLLEVPEQKVVELMERVSPTPAQVRGPSVK